MYKKLLFLSSLLFLSTLTHAEYYVGTWSTNITPLEDEALQSCMGGYGEPFSRCGNTLVRDTITAKVLSISDSDTEVIFAVIDTIGVGDSLISDIKDHTFNISGGIIPKDSIQIIATHTHSGPDLQGLWGGVSSSYRQRIIEQVSYSILLARLVSIESDISVLTLNDKAKVTNRRGWDEVNDDISLLDIKVKNTNFRIATLVNMSAHPTILDETNMAYSSGYIHFVRKLIQRRLGGNTIFINGVVGDAEPIFNGMRTYQQVRKFGKETAQNIIKNIDYAKPINGDFTIETFNFSHRVTNPGVIGAVQLGLLDLELDQNLNINTQFSLMSFGDDVSAILFPGEALTRLAYPILEEIDSEHKFFFGLTNDSLGYFIPSDEFLMIEGRTTEEAASLDIFIGDEIQSAIIDAL